MRVLMLLAFFGIAAAGTTVAEAETFRVVQDRDSFISIVTGRKLTRLGIALNVTDTGAIQGRAFGKPVSGEWRWENGFFCRSLYHGRRDLGPNCQKVTVRGDTIRFTSDRGAGIYADLKLR